MSSLGCPLFVHHPFVQSVPILGPPPRQALDTAVSVHKAASAELERRQAELLQRQAAAVAADTANNKKKEDLARLRQVSVGENSKRVIELE